MELVKISKPCFEKTMYPFSKDNIFLDVNGYEMLVKSKILFQGF